MTIDTNARTIRPITSHWVDMPKNLTPVIATIRASTKSTVVQLSNFAILVNSILYSIVFSDLNDASRPGSWLCLSKHVHNDHVAGLVVHHKVKHVSSHLVGIEVHGVITRVELISVILYSVRIGLNYLIEASRPSNRRIGD